MLDSVKELFEGAAAKYLSSVDADSSRSNQHEIGGLPSAGFKAHLGSPEKDEEYRFPCLMAYLTDEDEPILCQDNVTWYDCRRHSPHRSPEYRLYYKSNTVTEQIQPSDFFLVAKKRDGTLLLLFTPAGSSIEHQLRHLFGLSSVREQGFIAATMPMHTLVLPIKLLLSELGIEAFVESDAQDELNMLLEKFPDKFPSTGTFSTLARDSVDIDCLEAPDAALIGWMEREEVLFRAYERHIVAEKLRRGFGSEGDDVDEFITFSLSVQNRRKSRVGHAFENHLGTIFHKHALPHEKGSALRVTENRAKPDFLFPSFTAYHDLTYSTAKIFLLGAKTTCKDRWRQVLSEGDRLERKYLATMEPGISTSQTDEMRSKNLQLVVPSAIHDSFSSDQRDWLYSISDFITMVKEAHPVET